VPKACWQAPEQCSGEVPQLPYWEQQPEAHLVFLSGLKWFVVSTESKGVVENVAYPHVPS
jgi:hypothetical protein